MQNPVRASRKARFYLVTTAILALAGAAQAQPAAQPASGDTSQSANTVKEVVVTGQRAAINSAVQRKKNADVILDSVSADDAGKLPDNSVTEVLQRLPGVNITRIQTGVGQGSENFLAEGTDLTIRGLPSTSLLNGRDSFSSVNGRSLAWEDIPPELMQGVDVVKSEAAYLPEGAFGGIVNLRTRQPFDFSGLKVEGYVGGNYADYAGEAKPEGNLLVSDRWQTPAGEFGVLVDVAYSDLVTKADGVQVQPYLPQVYDPTLPTSALVGGNADGQRLPNMSDPGAQLVYEPFGVDFSQRVDDRVREGLYLATQWRPNDQLLLGFTVFDSHYQLSSFQHYLMMDDSTDTVVPVGANATFNKNGQLTSASALEGYAYTQGGSLQGSAAGGGSAGNWGYTNNPYDFQSVLQNSVNQTVDYSLTADWRPTDRFDLKMALQHVDSYATETDHYAYSYAYMPPVGIQLSSYGSSALPKLTIPSSVDLTNPANSGYLATMDHLVNNQGSENAFYADGTYHLSDDGLFRTLGFGVKLTARNENDEQTPYNYQALSPFYATPCTTPPPAGTCPTSGPQTHYSYLTSYPQYSQLVNTGSWFNGQMGLPAEALFPSLAMLNTNFGTLHNELGITAADQAVTPIQFTSADNSQISENTQTVYLMASFRDDDHFFVPFNGNIGVRVVADQDKAQGSLLYPAATGIELTPPTYPQALNYSSSSTEFAWLQSSTFSKGGHSQVNVLPSLNIQFLPTPQTHIRFAASESLQRPSFAQLNPQGTLGATYESSYQSNFYGSLQGDPNLKPERATQLDASIEYYFKNNGQMHLAVFYKSISDYIGTTSGEATYTIPAHVYGGNTTGVSYAGGGNYALQPCPQPMTVPKAGAAATSGSSCPQTVEYTSQSYFNENPAATIEGVEVGIQRYANFLPKPWSGFGIDANYTYIDSQQPGAVAYNMLGQKISDLPVTGLSKDTINFTVMYDNGPLSMRLAYNWRDDYLVTTSAYQTSGTYVNLTNVPDTTNAASVNQYGQLTYYSLPLFAYPIGTLDGNLTYKLSDRISWDLQASNLTKATTRLYMGEGDERANRSWYTADRRYTTRIHFMF